MDTAELQVRDNITPLAGETMSPQEVTDIEDVIRRQHDMMVKRDAGVAQQRDVHTKMIGLLRAEFTVSAELPPELRVGLFAQPATYKAWVRFSNGSNDINPDAKGDPRGMGIKLMGVPGTKVLPELAHGTTHDFTLVTSPNFPTSDAPGTFVLLGAVIGNLWVKLKYALTHPWGAVIVATTQVKTANVLQRPYFSIVPFAFGDQVVKYHAKPQLPPQCDRFPFAPTYDFLRERLVRDLSSADFMYDFCVQFQRDEASMPLEDLRQTWSERLSPPRKVATLRILQQEFDTPERRRYGQEGLSFTPWNCLPEHTPLGRLNRARRAIYETLSKFRHRRNDAPRVEPEDWVC